MTQNIEDTAAWEQAVKELNELARLYPPETNNFLAPNGKKSNLSREQWYYVRTRSFKEKFGDWERLAKIDDLLNADKDTSLRKNRRSIGKAGTTEINVFKNATGIDISDYNHTIDRSEINHTKNNHGNEKIESDRGQIALTDDDFRMIPLIIANADKVEYSGKNEPPRDKPRGILSVAVVQRRFFDRKFFIPSGLIPPFLLSLLFNSRGKPRGIKPDFRITKVLTP